MVLDVGSISLNVTLANYRGGLPFAVCCSRPYIVYQTVKKLHFCRTACVGAAIGRPRGMTCPKEE